MDRHQEIGVVAVRARSPRHAPQFQRESGAYHYFHGFRLTFFHLRLSYATFTFRLYDVFRAMGSLIRPMCMNPAAVHRAGEETPQLILSVGTR